VDNYNPVRTDLVFFPQLLQRAGCETAFFGNAPRRAPAGPDAAFADTDGP
jgi:hypothetical protein